MDTQSLEALALEPLPCPPDRLYRVAPDVYEGMVGHGLIDRDRVVLADGLLTNGGADAEGADPADRLYRMPLDVYHGIADHGLLGPRDQVVLLDGLLVKKMTRGQPHVVVTHLVVSALDRVIPGGWFVFKEDPVALPTGPGGHASEPEPDAAVVRGSVRDYLTRRVGPGDLALVVEVADSSLRDDRKGLARYAWAKVPVAWIVNLTNGTVEVYSRPTGPVGPSKYEDSQVFQKGDRLPVVVDGREVGQVAVVDLLP